MIRRLAARLATMAGDVADWVAYRRAADTSAIEEVVSGRLDAGGVARLAIFMHFDRDGAIAGYVRHYLRALRAAGFEIVFVSNAPRLDATDIAPLCRAVVRRRNIGLDFGAWKDCWLALEGRDGLDLLLLANDSVYGPLHDLAPLVARADPAVADVWGATDNWEGGPHLQSYFLLIHARALRHPAFAAFWRGVRHVASKRWIVRRYEIGLTRGLAAAGLRCAALFPYDRVAAAAPVRHDRPVNPTHFFWDTLIARAGFPFLKRDLLARNQHGLPVENWRAVVAAASPYDAGLIDRHLAENR
ncbi:MAG: polysaccharide biosynthesis-like protein [Alphaproteobacteria bacterium]|jgi:lipopolysaccharide biosynthesis protein|nr:polysaccharide biosynthesis-like protein [Alphaproteobacteria bacterium]